MKKELQQEMGVIDEDVRSEPSGSFPYLYMVRYRIQERDGFCYVTMQQPIEYASDIEMTAAACAAKVGIKKNELMIVEWKLLRGYVRPGQEITET